MRRAGPGDQRLDRSRRPCGGSKSSASSAPDARQHLHRPLADPAQVDARGEVEEPVERPALGAGGGDQPHRLDPDALQRPERVDDPAVRDAEGRARAVHAGRDHPDAEPVHLLLVGPELVGQVDVAVHHRGHELDRVVRLQPGGLVADHAVGGGVALVEAVVGELVEQVPDLLGLGLAHAVRLGAVEEQRLLRVHLGLDLLAHRPAQQVGAAEAEARQLAGDLHHLLLVDDDALRLVEDRVDRRVQRLPRLAPVLDVAELRDVLHRPGPVERDQRDDVLDAGRLELAQRGAHARAFHLEHRDRAGRRIDLVGLARRRAGSPRCRRSPRAASAGPRRSGSP